MNRGKSKHYTEPFDAIPLHFMLYQTELLLNMVFRLSPYEMNGKLKKNTCFFPNDYFEMS